MFHKLHKKLKSVIAAPSTTLLGQAWLCDSCIQMVKTIQNVKRPLEHPLYGLCEDIHQSMEGIYAAAAGGCGICSKLVLQLDRTSPRWYEEISQETALRFEAYESGKNIILSFTAQQHWPEDEHGLTLSLTCYNAPARAFEADIIHETDTLQRKGYFNNIMLARRWLETCLHTHRSCATAREEKFIPPRILDLRNTRVRLVEDTEGMTSCSYVALSHCWGTDPTTCKLTASNRSSFCADIPEASLPQTFQDAVFISRALGFQWLWIDSLCIIQSSLDDNENQHDDDWRRHIAIMDRVYQNCVVNITAADGDNPASGCIGGDAAKELPCIRMMPQWTFGKRGLTRSSSLKLSVIEEASSLNERYDDFIKLHLHTRGWVVQERLLSPRTIHFTKSQTFWECSKVPLACQDFPLSMDVELPGLNRKGGSRGHSPYSWKSEDPTKQHGRWLDILEDYTRRSLTRPVDRLPAIAGIASRVNSVLQDTYRAGHFKSKLLYSLLWQCKPTSPSESAESRALSWSWASIDTGVNWDRRMTTAWRVAFESDRQMRSRDMERKGKRLRKPKAMTASASVIDMHVELVDPSNEFGQVRSGFVILKGPLVEILWDIHVRDFRQDPGRQNPYAITLDVDNLKSRVLALAFDSGQLRDTWTMINLLVLWHDDERMIESGLIIVEKCADCAITDRADLGLPKQFVRVGVFKSCDDDTTFEEWSNPIFARYTYREVTIV